MSGLVYECEINFLTIERAAKLVPPEYIAAWSWFIKNQGQHIPALPMGKYKPEGMKLPLARQAGIYCPSYENLPSKGAGKESYVLSVHSEGQSIYPDHEKLDRPDGTWILDYHEQQGLDRSQDYNRKLLRCMEDGIPVGVMVRSRKGKGYTVLGLAFVEQYNSATHMFTFHGPVNKETVADGLYATFSLADVKPDELSALKDSDGADERKRAVAERVVRERQDKFRKALLDAYGNACAITDIDVRRYFRQHTSTPTADGSRRLHRTASSFGQTSICFTTPTSSQSSLAPIAYARAHASGRHHMRASAGQRSGSPRMQGSGRMTSCWSCITKSFW